MTSCLNTSKRWRMKDSERMLSAYARTEEADFYVEKETRDDCLIHDALGQ